VRTLLRQGGYGEVAQGVQQVTQVVAQAGRSRVEGQPLKSEENRLWLVICSTRNVRYPSRNVVPRTQIPLSNKRRKRFTPRLSVSKTLDLDFIKIILESILGTVNLSY
jgi:hypothetical protein